MLMLIQNLAHRPTRSSQFLRRGLLRCQPAARGTTFMPKSQCKVYAVRKGHRTGIFQTWDEVKPLVNGFAGAQHKSFASWEAASQWMGEANGGTIPLAQPTQQQPRPAMQSSHAHPAARDMPESISPRLNGVATSCRTAPYQRSPASGGEARAAAIMAAFLPGSHQQRPQQQQQEVHQFGGPHQTSVAGAFAGGVNAGASTLALQTLGAPPRRIVRRKGLSINPDQQYTVVFDGGARGNPGRAGSGAAVIDPSGRTVAEIVLPLGCATNNVAEYQGLINGLEVALEMGVRNVVAFGDSELVCRQVSGRYQCRNAGLVPLLHQVHQLVPRFAQFELRHVLREYNTLADGLSNEAMDMR